MLVSLLDCPCEGTMCEFNCIQIWIKRMCCDTAFNVNDFGKYILAGYEYITTLAFEFDGLIVNCDKW